MSHYKAHLFVCTNDRGEGARRESCARKGADALRGKVKEMCKARGIQGVRINSSGCLDQCERGMVAVLYPQGEWFEDIRPDDAEALVDAVEKAAKGE